MASPPRYPPLPLAPPTPPLPPSASEVEGGAAYSTHSPPLPSPLSPDDQIIRLAPIMRLRGGGPKKKGGKGDKGKKGKGKGKEDGKAPANDGEKVRLPQSLL